MDSLAWDAILPAETSFLPAYATEASLRSTVRLSLLSPFLSVRLTLEADRWTHLSDQGRNYQYYYFLEDYNTAARLLEGVEKELYFTHEEQPTDTQIYLHQRIKPVLARQSRLRSEAYRVSLVHLGRLSR